MKIGLLIFIVVIQCSLFSIVPPLNILASNNEIAAQSIKSQHFGSPPCKEIDWAVWNSIADKTAAATINTQQNSVKLTITSNLSLESAPKITRHEAFKRFKAPIPDAVVPRTSWSKAPGGVITVCFSQPVKEPVLLLASLGDFKERTETTIRFSEPYVMLYEAGGMSIINNMSLTGREGYALIKFPGEIKCITINASTFERFTDFTWGIPVCPEGIQKPVPAGIFEPQHAPAPLAALPRTGQSAPLDKPTSKSSAITPQLKATNPALKPVAEEPKANAGALARAEQTPKPILPAARPQENIATIKPDPEKKADESIADKVSENTGIALKTNQGMTAPIPESPPEPKKIIQPAVVKPLLVPVPKPEPLKPKPHESAAASQTRPANGTVTAAVKKASETVPALKTVKAPVDSSKFVKQEVIAPPVSGTKSVAAISKQGQKSTSVLPKPQKTVSSFQGNKAGSNAATTNPALSSPSAAVKRPLRVEIWDYDGMDYDSVSLKLNGQQVGASAIQLQLYKRSGSSASRYPLDLQPGENILEIYAISEGLKPTTTIGLLIMYEDKPKKLYFTLKARETTVIRL